MYSPFSRLHIEVTSALTAALLAKWDIEIGQKQNGWQFAENQQSTAHLPPH